MSVYYSVTTDNGSGSVNLTAEDTGLGPAGEEITTEDWGFLVNQSLGHLIVLVGVVGNCLSFLVMKSKALRQKSYSHYLCALAVFDSIVLCTREFHHVNQLLTFLGKPGLLFYFNTPGCKMFLFVETVGCLMSSWLVVAMAMERLLVVYRPFRKNVLCTQKGAIVVITSMVVIFSYTQVFRFVMVVKDSQEGECLSHVSYESVYLVLHVYVYQIALAFLLPVIIVFVCNICVLRKIFQVDRNLREDENSASTRLTEAISQRSKTTRLLLAIGFVFVFTLLPANLLSIILLVAFRVHGVGARPLVLSVIPVMNVLVVVSDVNYAANFYIYVLSGKKFRLELRKVMCAHCFRYSGASAARSPSGHHTRETLVLS